MEYHITQYDLEQGALEIQYIEEFFGEFPRKKTAAEIVRRLNGRAHLILLANAPLPDDPGTVVPVSFKVAHEITGGRDASRSSPTWSTGCATTCSSTAAGCSTPGLAAPGATGAARGISVRSPSSRNCGRSQQGFDEIVVKTKNKFYEMRGTLDHLRFEVVKYERNPADNARVEGVFEQEAVAGSPRRAPQREDRRAGHRS